MDAEERCDQLRASVGTLVSHLRQESIGFGMVGERRPRGDWHLLIGAYNLEDEFPKEWEGWTVKVEDSSKVFPFFKKPETRWWIRLRKWFNSYSLWEWLNSYLKRTK